MAILLTLATELRQVMIVCSLEAFWWDSAAWYSAGEEALNMRRLQQARRGAIDDSEAQHQGTR